VDKCAGRGSDNKARDERHGLWERKGVGSQRRFQLAQLVVWRVLQGKSQRPLHMRDHGIERTVLSIEAQRLLDPGIPLTCQVLFELLHEARFPNAGLTVDQHHLAQPILDLGPALPQQGHFGAAPHQRRQPAGSGHIEPVWVALACST